MPAGSYWAPAWARPLVLVVAVAFVVAWRQGRSHAIDRSAHNLARDRGPSRYREGKAKLAPGVFTGPSPVTGAVVPGAKLPLRATWEDMLTVAAGPRTGRFDATGGERALFALSASHQQPLVIPSRGA
ncbi:MAG: hypothetical protein ACRDZX_02055 [Acidimicrobiales bacterium]